jgi:hypothetical protein
MGWGSLVSGAGAAAASAVAGDCAANSNNSLTSPLGIVVLVTLAVSGARTTDYRGEDRANGQRVSPLLYYFNCARTHTSLVAPCLIDFID